jgi:hypothetical protein
VSEPHRQASSSDLDRPAHPTGKAIVLVIGVVFLLVVLAAISTFA